MNEEVLEEFQVLESIYGDRILIDTEARPPTIQTTLTPQTIPPSSISLHLTFTLSPSYPESMPTIQIEQLSGAFVDCGGLKSVLTGVGEREEGMAMIFSLITEAEQWIDESITSANSGTGHNGTGKQQQQSKQKSKLIEKGEEEGNEDSSFTSINNEDSGLSMTGGPVTPETFANWKLSFSLEQARSSSSPSLAPPSKADPRPTGKQIFEAAQKSGEGGKCNIDGNVLECDDASCDVTIGGEEDGLWEGLDELDISKEL